jgi:hypothetical protein
MRPGLINHFHRFEIQQFVTIPTFFSAAFHCISHSAPYRLLKLSMRYSITSKVHQHAAAASYDGVLRPGWRLEATPLVPKLHTT